MSDVSFIAKDPIQCPVCGASFNQEILRAGRGRLIAGELLTDLRRSYKPSPKFGAVNPLIYNIIVCPECLYAVMSEDFKKPKANLIEKIKAAKDNRKKYTMTVFGEDMDFSEKRTLMTGAASMFLAISTYSNLQKEIAPSVKKAICSIRASWLCNDLIKEYPNRNFEILYWYFRKLAWKMYDRVIKYAESGEENFDAIKKLGPDLDTDYGYNGALYIASYLSYELKDIMDEIAQYKKLFYYRTTLGKVFGFGRSSKEKPSTILAYSKYLHGKFGILISEFEKKYGDIKNLD